MRKAAEKVKNFLKKGLKKVKKAFKREDGPIIITQPDGPAYVHSEPATDALDLFEDFD